MALAEWEWVWIIAVVVLVELCGVAEAAVPAVAEACIVMEFPIGMVPCTAVAVPQGIWDFFLTRVPQVEESLR
jgi:hypothetical protein